MMITHERLLKILWYNPETGVFTWKFVSGRKLGAEAGSKIPSGYIAVQTKGKSYLAHRLAWFYVNKIWPMKEIDHINGNKLDNRIVNLREVSRRENAYNRGATKSNKLGLKGIRKRGNSFEVRIRNKEGVVHIDTFCTLSEAQTAYLKLAKEIHGLFIHSSVLSHAAMG